MKHESPHNSFEPLISVVIATHNYARFLPDALRSVQAQTYAKWECIVVDDASIDETQQVVKGFAAADARIRYFRNEQNLGEAGTRNVGNRHAVGQYIAVLDADDWWRPEKLQRQIDCLRQAPDTVLCFAAICEESVRGKRNVGCPEYWLADLDTGLRSENLIIHSSVLVSRSAFELVAGYDETLPTAPDWELWLRLLCRFGAGSFQYLDESLVHYRVHGSNISSNGGKMTRAERQIIRRYLMRRAWGLRHLVGAHRVIDEQIVRETARLEKASELRRAFYSSCRGIALGPMRLWRWRRAMRLLAQSRAGIAVGGRATV